MEDFRGWLPTRTDLVLHIHVGVSLMLTQTVQRHMAPRVAYPLRNTLQLHHPIKGALKAAVGRPLAEDGEGLEGFEPRRGQANLQTDPSYLISSHRRRR